MTRADYDVNLVQAAMTGDRNARERLLTACAPDVVRWCLRAAGGRVNAEDAAQDVLVIVITKLDRLREPERFSERLFGIVRRVLASHRRRASVRRWVPGLDLGLMSSERPDPEQELATSRRSRRVLELVEELPEEQRDAVLEMGLLGCSGKEVAERHGRPHATVRRSKQRGEAKLRRMAAEDEELADLLPAAQGEGK